MVVRAGSSDLLNLSFHINREHLLSNRSPKYLNIIYLSACCTLSFSKLHDTKSFQTKETIDPVNIHS